MACYKKNNSQLPYDLNSVRYVGWDENIGSTPKNEINYNDMYSQVNVNLISQIVTNYLMKLKGKPIIVSDVQIREMINSVWNAEQGRNYPNIYTIDTFDLNWDKCEEWLKRINLIVIQSIISQIKNEVEVEEINNNLSIWTTVLGDFNEEGLRAHSKIKLREKHPALMQFHMHY
jgi:hypothetical protein